MGLTNEQKNERDRITQRIPTFTSEGREDYVFISYKSDDWEKVLGKIVRHMVDTYGLRVYFDKNFDRDNDSWVSNMTGAIRTGKCRAVLAFVSKQYMVSYACLMELLTARGYYAFMDHGQDKENKLQIFPIIVDDSHDLKDTVSSSGKKVTMSDAEWDCYLELLEEASKCPWVSGSEKLKNQIDYLKDQRKKNVNEEHISRTAELILSEGHERHFCDGVEGTSFYSALYESIRKCSRDVFDPALIQRSESVEKVNMVRETGGKRTGKEARETGGSGPVSGSAWNRDPIRVFRRKFELLSERYKEEWKKKNRGNTPAIEMSLRINLQIPGMSRSVLSGRNLKALFRDLMNLIYQSYGETYFVPAAKQCIDTGNGYPLIITDAFYSSKIEDRSRYNRVEHSDYHFYNSYSARDLVRAFEKQLEMLFHFLGDRGAQVSLDDVMVEYRFEDSDVRNYFAALEAEGVKVKQPAVAESSGAGRIVFEAEDYIGFMRRYRRAYQNYRDAYQAGNSGNTPAVPFEEMTIILPPSISVRGKVSHTSWKGLLQLLMDDFSEATNGEYEAYRSEEEAKKGLKEPAVIPCGVYESGTVDTRQYQPVRTGRYYYQNWFSTQEAMKAIRKELEIYIRYRNERYGGQNDISEIKIAYTIRKGLFTEVFSKEG